MPYRAKALVDVEELDDQPIEGLSMDTTRSGRKRKLPARLLDDGATVKMSRLSTSVRSSEEGEDEEDEVKTVTTTPRPARARKKSAKLQEEENHVVAIPKKQPKGTPGRKKSSKTHEVKNDADDVDVDLLLEQDFQSFKADLMSKLAPAIKTTKHQVAQIEVKAETVQPDAVQVKKKAVGRKKLTKKKKGLYKGALEARKQQCSVPNYNSGNWTNQTQPAHINNKDKKARVTAYSLWCQNTRPQLLRQYPSLDTLQLRKLLTEHWDTVPFKEKRKWRLRAKRAKLGSSQAPPRRPPVASRSTTSSSLMRAGPGRPRTVEKLPDTANFKVIGHSDMAVAAHLSLLGESLGMIGQRLQQHKGNIAVQGSLSVLLDTLLCAIGPLMCLTESVPELKDAIPSDRMNHILDNIAYVMPGIG